MSVPESWHHGLMARWWAEFNHAEPHELAYYGAAIDRFGQPALDLACGAGRLLLPLLERGVDIDGVDLSEDMLEAARRLAAARGLVEPNLSAQAMHELSLERRYGTIYICDSFGLGGHREHDREALRRIHRHLRPSGALVLSHYLPYDDATPDGWAEWLSGHRRDYPRPWPAEGNRRRLADGDELELRVRGVDFDPLLQRRALEMRMSLWHLAEIIAEESRLLQENLYFAQELLVMLSDAGFEEVRMEAAYQGRPATAEDSALVFIARRP